MVSNFEQALAESDEIEAAEYTTDPDAPLPAHVKVSQPGHARSKVLQIRLNPEEMTALETIAKRRGLPVSTVAREHILRLLADDDKGSGPLAQLLTAAARVKELADDVRRQIPPGLTVDPQLLYVPDLT